MSDHLQKAREFLAASKPHRACLHLRLAREMGQELAGLRSTNERVVGGTAVLLAQTQCLDLLLAPIVSNARQHLVEHNHPQVAYERLTREVGAITHFDYQISYYGGYQKNAEL